MVKSCLAFFLAALASLASAQHDVNAQFRNPDYHEWRSLLESEEREVYVSREAIVAAVGSKSGMAIADIGAGSGLFTMLFAREVGPTGRVYAVDIAREFITGIEQRAREEGLKNVVGILSADDDAKLAPASVDIAFVCDAYHHFARPELMLGSISRGLRAGGALVIVDFERKPGQSPDWIVRHVRAGKETVRREIESAGFRFVEEVPLMRGNYFLRFRKE
jgi:ubiquinone/menaquinone biosynthesis C-methylase UbiE